MLTAQTTALGRPLFEDSNNTNSVRSGLALPAAGAAASEHRGAAESVAPSASELQRAFVLSVVQPGLAGLMDGSISSLAPLFAAAFATRDSHTAFLVCLATAMNCTPQTTSAITVGCLDQSAAARHSNNWWLPTSPPSRSR